MRLTAQGTGGGTLERNTLLEEPKNLPTNMKSLPSKTMKSSPCMRMTSLLNDLGTSDDRSDDNMDEEDGVSNIEQFSTSEDSNVSPSQRKRGARPEAHVKKKSRSEE